MDALVNYGSDDESSDKYQENKGPRNEEMKTSGRSLSDTVEDVNYDNVQMDMSEESDAGQRPKVGRSSSSCPSSSSEAEEEALHVKPCVPSGLSSQDAKRVVREKEVGSSRHRRREESRRSPGHKEKQKKKDRSGRRSRSKDRSEKSKESKEKERRRRESSRERGGTYDGESKESYRKDCRSRSRERSRYRHHSERRRSRSRSPHHHHRHHHRHHDDERRSKRSRGRSSSRNHSPEGGRNAEAKKASAVSRAVAAAAANINAAVAATEAATKNESNSELEEDGGYSANGKSGQQATSLEGLGNQSESGSAPKAAVGGLAASLLSPQLLVQRSLEVQATHLHNATGIQFPAYYNPAAMNPLKYAEQMQKRKKLWSGNKDTAKETGNTSTSGSTNNWESTTFAQDQDGKLSAKFKRLMGIKTPGATTAPAAGQLASTSQPSEDVIKKQEELFSTMERQYEAARLATHTLRGVGLGFGSSSSYQYPR